MQLGQTAFLMNWIWSGAVVDSQGADSASASSEYNFTIDLLSPQDSFLRENPQIANRIKTLIKQEHMACQSQLTVPNCFGTLLWTVGIGEDPLPVEYGEAYDGHWDEWDNANKKQRDAALINLLVTAGYEKPFARLALSCPTDFNDWDYQGDEPYPALQPSHVANVVAAPECKTHRTVAAHFDFLKPGDVLLFGSFNAANPNFVHAALYIGTDSQGRHILFEKPSRDCGPLSPFRLRTLEEYLGHAATPGHLEGDREFDAVYVLHPPESD